jgi:colanic acid biosynthesis glycosyl transferase WcaI
MALQTLWKPDIVFTIEPTFFAAPVALLAAALSGAASWLHVQDFEVDAAFDLKLLPPDGPIHTIAKGLERFFTGSFSRVSSISNKMVERITARGDAHSAVVLFPNWGDIEMVRPAAPDAENSFRSELALADKIVLLYSGNMGAKQGLDVLGPLTEFFSGNPHVHFLFCGDGVYRPQLERLVGHRRNVTMLPLQPASRLNDLLNVADIHLLPQRRGAADLVMPSKLNGILASGRPVVAMADEGTQVAHVVAGCGLVVPAEDPAALCAATARLVESAELRASLGLAAREYAVKYLSKERVLRRFELDMLALLTPPEKTEEVQLARSYRG